MNILVLLSSFFISNIVNDNLPEPEFQLNFQVDPNHFNRNFEYIEY